MVKILIQAWKIHKKKQRSSLEERIAHICKTDTRYLFTGCLFLTDLAAGRNFFKKFFQKVVVRCGFNPGFMKGHQSEKKQEHEPFRKGGKHAKDNNSTP